MPHHDQSVGIAAEARRPSPRPINGGGRVAHEALEADLRIDAVIRHHDDDAGLRQRARDERIIRPIALLPGAAIEEDDDGSPARIGGPVDVEHATRAGPVSEAARRHDAAIRAQPVQRSHAGTAADKEERKDRQKCTHDGAIYG